MARKNGSEREENGQEILRQEENLHLLVNLVAVYLTRDLSISDQAVMLGDAGLSNNRIAALVGSTADSIRALRNQAKREKSSNKRSKR